MTEYMLGNLKRYKDAVWKIVGVYPRLCPECRQIIKKILEETKLQTLLEAVEHE